MRTPYQEIHLTTAAWYGDKPLILHFPHGWEIIVISGQSPPPLPKDEFRDCLQHPIGTLPLSELARGKNQAAIIVDDLTRPTPVESIAKVVVEELNRAGIRRSSINLVIGGGTHEPASPEDTLRKFEWKLSSGIQVTGHDCRNNLSYLGKTHRGTPVYVNRTVMQADLKIGIGSVYPHPTASFSGGAKMLAPAVCGWETIKSVHQRFGSSEFRAASLDTLFRQEIEEIASLAGLDFIVNSVINQNRQITAVLAGDKILAHRQAINVFRQIYQIIPIWDVDVMITDMYPFDTDLQFAIERGLWPFLAKRSNASKVVLAGCPRGMGTHALYPLDASFAQRFYQRMKNYRRKTLKWNSANRPFRRRRLSFTLLSQGITRQEIKPVFPRAKIAPTWDIVLKELEKVHPNPPVRVVIYRCAPFLIPPDIQPLI